MSYLAAVDACAADIREIHRRFPIPPVENRLVVAHFVSQLSVKPEYSQTDGERSAFSRAIERVQKEN